MKKNLKIGEAVDYIPTLFPTKNGEDREIIICKR